MINVSELITLKPNYENTSAMCLAANLAGKAINISKTTSCHALSYYFTSNFKIPHGQSVAMIMPYVFDYHYYQLSSGYC